MTEQDNRTKKALLKYKDGNVRILGLPVNKDQEGNNYYPQKITSAAFGELDNCKFELIGEDTGLIVYKECSMPDINEKLDAIIDIAKEAEVFMTEQEKAFIEWWEKIGKNNLYMHAHILDAKFIWNTAIEWQKAQEEKKRCETCKCTNQRDEIQSLCTISGNWERNDFFCKYWEEKS